MDKYTLMGLNRAENWVILAKCDSLLEAHKLMNFYRYARGVKRYKDLGIKYP
jgi:hypothetical protein